MPKDEKIVEIGPHTNMTPEQALAYCAREKWESVVIVGYKCDSEGIVVRSSKLTREHALWIAEQFRYHVLDMI
jgi:hypothetical protein